MVIQCGSGALPLYQAVCQIVVALPSSAFWAAPFSPTSSWLSAVAVQVDLAVAASTGLSAAGAPAPPGACTTVASTSSMAHRDVSDPHTTRQRTSDQPPGRPWWHRRAVRGGAFTHLTGQTGTNRAEASQGWRCRVSGAARPCAGHPP